MSCGAGYTIGLAQMWSGQAGTVAEEANGNVHLASRKWVWKRAADSAFVCFFDTHVGIILLISSVH